MHRELVGVRLPAKQGELPAQPGPKQREQLIGLTVRGVVELRKFGSQCANWTAVALNVGAVRDKDMDEAVDAVLRCIPFDFPPL